MTKRVTDDRLRKKVVGYSCLYCGLPRACYDHFPPVSSGTLGGWLLPSCTECNSLIGASHAQSFDARVDFLKRKLRTRLARHLATPAWGTDEVEELGPGLRAVAAGWQAQREEAQARLHWNPEAYLASLGYEVAMCGRALQSDEWPGVREDLPTGNSRVRPLPGPAKGI